MGVKNKETLFCGGWEFSKNPIGTEYSDNLDWKSVDLPHDWLIYQTEDLYETSTGWYRKNFAYTKREGIRTALRFGGVYMDSRLYVNGELAFEWKYGYSTFEADITEFLRDGENLIAVRVDHRSPNSRWYSGAGIFRKVYLKEYPECHIARDGVYISADIGGDVTISAEVIRPENVQVGGLSIVQEIFDGDKLLAFCERNCCACDRSVIPEAIRREDVRYSVNTVAMHIENPVLCPAVNQVETHLLCQRRTEREWFDKYHVQHMAYAPLGQGRINEMFENPALIEIAAAHGKTAAQCALRFLIQNGTIIIPKSTHKERIIENFDIFDFELSADEMGQLAKMDTAAPMIGNPENPYKVEEAMKW